jgi:hypothetical protein
MGLSQGAPKQGPVLSKVEARQRVTGHNVRYVIWFGIAAAVVALAAVYQFYFWLNAGLLFSQQLRQLRHVGRDPPLCEAHNPRRTFSDLLKAK